MARRRKILEKKAVKKTVSPAPKTARSPFLDLPFEVRLDIYRYALSTTSDDNISASQTFAIEERRRLRSSFKKARENDYTLVNCTKNSAALGQTCSQVADEIDAYLPKPTFRFTSRGALYSFLGFDPSLATYQRNLKALKSASKVVVLVNERGFYESGFYGDSLIKFSNLLKEPLDVEFIPNNGSGGRELTRAKGIWEQFLNSFWRRSYSSTSNQDLHMERWGEPAD